MTLKLYILKKELNNNKKKQTNNRSRSPSQTLSLSLDALIGEGAYSYVYVAYSNQFKETSFGNSRANKFAVKRLLCNDDTISECNKVSTCMCI